ncbi:MAG TPA: thiamine diphosphokinase [Fimbriimonadales bacterium]|jgi:thiamine pyrophosphokinase|nr:thiamine diphosphokinase [Fimbriimonadales bacterium]
MKTKGRIAIMLAGDAELGADLRPWLDGAHTIIAADGGADTLLEHGVVPDVVVGDMDSISRSALDSVGPERVVRLLDQNTTDFQKAMRYAAENLEPSEVVILGSEGARLDHMLSEWIIVTLFAERFRVRFVLSNWIVYALAKGEHRIPSRRMGLVSLLPLSTAKVAAGSGLEYGVDDLEIGPGARNGISNRATGDLVEITVETGTVLAFVARFEGDVQW